MLGDVSQAFVHAAIDGNVYTMFPPEVNDLPLDTTTCGRLVISSGRLYKLSKALYGYGRSPQLWQQHLSAAQLKLGLRCLVVDAAVFTDDKEIMAMVHVDDIAISRPREDILMLFPDLNKDILLKRVALLG